MQKGFCILHNTKDKEVTVNDKQCLFLLSVTLW